VARVYGMLKELAGEEEADSSPALRLNRNDKA
jgi:hypothetical protein